MESLKTKIDTKLEELEAETDEKCIKALEEEINNLRLELVKLESEAEEDMMGSNSSKSSVSKGKIGKKGDKVSGKDSRRKKKVKEEVKEEEEEETSYEDEEEEEEEEVLMDEETLNLFFEKSVTALGRMEDYHMLKEKYDDIMNSISMLPTSKKVKTTLIGDIGKVYKSFLDKISKKAFSGFSSQASSSSNFEKKDVSKKDSVLKSLNYDISSNELHEFFEIPSDLEVINEDMAGFGMLNSREYRKKFFSITSDMSSVARFWVIFFATAVKSRQRILNGLKRFEGKPWFMAVNNFYANKCVQYTSDLKPMSSKFAVVHITSCAPNLAALCFVLMNRAKTVEDFLSNLWAAQLNLDNDCQMIQLEWEENFWNNTVTKGSRSYLEGFNRDFYKTKSMDTYPLLNLKTMMPVEGTITREAIKLYITSSVES